VGSQQNLLVAQAGGATAVINSSLAGVVEAARERGQFRSILGARRGIEGVLRQDLVDLGAQPPGLLQQVARTPSATLGVTRLRLSPEAAQLALEILARYDVGAFVYIGGNDSAETAHRLASAAQRAGCPLQVVVVPKTIDNDLPATDHCPGYGSIARFMALATRDAGLDTEATAGLYPVKLIEVMGRNAGWVAASTALAKRDASEAPHLIFFPERPPASLDAFLEEIAAAHQRYGHVVAIVPETLRDAQGRPLGGEQAQWVDPFGHPYYPGPVQLLARAIESRLRVRARYDKPGTIARTFAACVSPVDWQEAYDAGVTAVALLADGASDVMVSLERVSDEPYHVRFGTVPLISVANRERRLPDEFIAPDGRSITEAFRRYALPLIGGPLSPSARLADLPYRPQSTT
jgi:6-phosphofructokinase 1